MIIVNQFSISFQNRNLAKIFVMEFLLYIDINFVFGNSFEMVLTSKI